MEKIRVKNIHRMTCLHPKVIVCRRRWIFRKYDLDPFPSIPHGHSEDNKYKLNIDTGEIVDKQGHHVGQVSKKELNSLLEVPNFKDFVKEAKKYHEELKRGKKVVLKGFVSHQFHHLDLLILY